MYKDYMDSVPSVFVQYVHTCGPHITAKDDRMLGAVEQLEPTLVGLHPLCSLGPLSHVSCLSLLQAHLIKVNAMTVLLIGRVCS